MSKLPTSKHVAHRSPILQPGTTSASPPQLTLITKLRVANHTSANTPQRVAGSLSAYFNRLARDEMPHDYQHPDNVAKPVAPCCHLRQSQRARAIAINPRIEPEDGAGETFTPGPEPERDRTDYKQHLSGTVDETPDLEMARVMSEMFPGL